MNLFKGDKEDDYYFTEVPLLVEFNIYNNNITKNGTLMYIINKIHE
jgi:hypothetical protein